MSRCVICNTTEAIVYSGIDALLLRATKMVGKICYTCGNKKAEEAKAEYDKQMEWYHTLGKRKAQ
jgi:hypothetical protein